MLNVQRRGCLYVHFLIQQPGMYVVPLRPPLYVLQCVHFTYVDTIYDFCAFNTCAAVPGAVRQDECVNLHLTFSAMHKDGTKVHAIKCALTGAHFVADRLPHGMIVM